MSLERWWLSCVDSGSNHATQSGSHDLLRGFVAEVFAGSTFRPLPSKPGGVSGMPLEGRGPASLQPETINPGLPLAGVGLGFVFQNQKIDN